MSDYRESFDPEPCGACGAPWLRVEKRLHGDGWEKWVPDHGGGCSAECFRVDLDRHNAELKRRAARDD